MNKKRPEHIIKESFEQQTHAAPEGIWEQISEQLEQPISASNVDEKIKNSFESTKVKAPEQVFGNIEKQLNIDSVWLRINRVLNLDRIWFWARNSAILLLFFGLIYLGSVWTKSPVLENETIRETLKQEQAQTKAENQMEELGLGNNNTQTPSSNQPQNSSLDLDNEFPNSKIASNSKPISSPSSNSNPSLRANKDESSNILKPSEVVILKEKKAQTEERNPIFSSDSVIVSEDQTILKEAFSYEEEVQIPQFPLIPELNSKAFVLLENEIKSQTFEQLEWRALENQKNQGDTKGKEKRKKKSKFYLGLLASYNKSTINNSEFRESQLRTSLVASAPTYSFSYGFVVAYSLTIKGALVSEIYINNKYKQSVHGYQEGHYYHKETELDYSSVSLLYERKIPFVLFQKPLNIVVKSGAYYSILNQEKAFLDGKSIASKHEFVKSDYGFRLMLGQQTYLNRILLDYGVNASYGIKNIYKGNEYIPADFNRTNNYYIGVYLNFRYGL